MASAEITTAPNRRTLFKGMGAALGGALLADRAMETIADQAAVLGRDWLALRAQHENLVALEDRLMKVRAPQAERQRAAAAVSAILDRMSEIEDRLAEMTPTTPDGVAAQVRVLRDYFAGGEAEAMCDRALAALASMAGAA